MNTIDRIIAAISPARALNRERNRAALDALQQRRYNAGGKGVRSKNWSSRASSPNSEITRAGRTVLNRSRDLYENNPYFKKAVDDLTANLVGPGIRPTIDGLEGGGEKKVLTAWRNWAGKAHIDYRERQNFAGILALVARTVFLSGECLIIRRRGGRKAPIQLEVLECDHLDDAHGNVYNGNGYILDGIEYNERGKRVAYHIYDQHPHDNTILGQHTGQAHSRRVKAEDVIHIFHEVRPGQRRGIAHGHAAMDRIRNLDEYEDAELVAKKVAACLMGFVTDTSGLGADIGMVQDDGLFVDEIVPGTIEYLKPGQTVTFTTPPQNPNHESFTKMNLKGIATGMGTTYHTMAGDYSQVNFSSGRMGHMSMQSIIDQLRNAIIAPMLDRIWEWFTEMQDMTGKPIPEGATVRWIPPKKVLIDPEKEIKGTERALSAGLIDMGTAATEYGFDIDELLENRKKYMQRMDADGTLPKWATEAIPSEPQQPFEE